MMYSNTEHDPLCIDGCLIRNMEDVDFSEVHGTENLVGQYSWLNDYEYEDDSAEFLEMDRYIYGFNSEDVKMTVTLSDSGYYIAEFLTDLPAGSLRVGVKTGYKTRVMTLKEAIEDFMRDCISDGIGENEIGVVEYAGTTHDVWLGDIVELS